MVRLPQMTDTESIRIPKDRLDRIRKVADEQRRSLIAQITLVIDEWFGRKK